MRIELEPPYANDFISARTFFSKKEGRTYVHLRREDGSQASTSYARYLMATHLGRYLDKHEHVDHIDEDKTNDKIANLQILSHAENNRKHTKVNGKFAKSIELTCPVCGATFSRTERYIRDKNSQGQKLFTCSRKCGTSGTSFKTENFISNEIISKIKELRREGRNCYSIASELGVSRNTVMKYWK